MLKVVLGFLGMLYFSFAGYVIYEGTIILGVALLIIGVVITPLVLMYSEGGVRISSAPDSKSYNNSGFSGDGNS